MLLLFHPVGDMTIPMTVINVHTGAALLDINYTGGGRMRDIEFVE
jgi:hypothetical protein